MFLHLFAGAAWWKKGSQEGLEGQVNRCYILTSLVWTTPSILHQGLRNSSLFFHSYKDRLVHLRRIFVKMSDYLIICKYRFLYKLTTWIARINFWWDLQASRLFCTVGCIKSICNSVILNTCRFILFSELYLFI